MKLNIYHQTVINHIKKNWLQKRRQTNLTFVFQLLPYELTQKDSLNRISICEFLQERNELVGHEL